MLVCVILFGCGHLEGKDCGQDRGCAVTGALGREGAGRVKETEKKKPKRVEEDSKKGRKSFPLQELPDSLNKEDRTQAVLGSPMITME